MLLQTACLPMPNASILCLPSCIAVAGCPLHPSDGQGGPQGCPRHHQPAWSVKAEERLHVTWLASVQREQAGPVFCSRSSL